MILYQVLHIIIIMKNLESMFIEKIVITENTAYTAPLLDIHQLLVDKRILNIDTTTKPTIYSIMDTKSPFSLVHNKLYATTNVDREAICRPDDAGTINSFTTNKLLNDGSCTYTDCCTIFSFQVDYGSQINSYHILFVVQDQNDNFPKFLPFNNPYRVLAENTPISTIVELPLAIDLDSPLYGIKKYVISTPFLIGNTSHFLQSDKTTSGRPSLVLVSSLDREITSRYRFILKALDRDNEISHDTNDVEVEIKISDVNDNPPTFDKSFYSISIKEHSRITDLIYFKIFDPDEGLNADVTVSIELSNEMERNQLNKLFRVDFSKSAMTGSVRLIDDLDYEVHKNTFMFDLIARDNGRPSLSSSAKVTINVINENDHAPEIKIMRHGKKVTRSITITENQRAGTLVGLVLVSDKDSPVSSIECQLLDVQFNFNIRSTNENHSLGLYKEYMIQTVKPLDREDEHNDILSITIHCTDHNKLKPLHTNLTIAINIEDVNDNPPVFSRTKYQGELLENSPQTTIKMIEPIRTTDKDYGKYAAVTYKIDTTPNNTDWQLFSIDSDSGVIYSKIAIDYEENKLFRLIIKAIDKDNNTLTSTAIVIVHIIDANDNSPVFDSSHYSFTVKENVPINTVIGLVHATDVDTKTDNAQVKYFVKYYQSPHTLIQVEQNTGKLRTIGQIDREKAKSLSIIVTAKNELGYQSNNLIDPECMVDITVEDENDNAPMFTLMNHAKTTVTFYVNAAYKQENCQQIPYSVSDADQDEPRADDCCIIRLDNDYNGYFYLTSSMPNFLCLQSTVTSPAMYRVSLTATDNKNNQNNSLEAKISFNVFIKNEVTEREAAENRIISNKLPVNRNGNFPLIIVIVIVVVVCLLIIAFVLLILYRYVVNSAEDIPKRQNECILESTENNTIKMEYNPNIWSHEDGKLLYQHNSGWKNDLSYSKPMVNQEWYFEKPIYSKDGHNSYQTMTPTQLNTKYNQNLPVNYEPLTVISSAGQDYITLDNKPINSTMYKSCPTNNNNTDLDDVNINCEDTHKNYCHTSFV